MSCRQFFWMIAHALFLVAKFFTCYCCCNCCSCCNNSKVAALVTMEEGTTIIKDVSQHNESACDRWQRQLNDQIVFSIVIPIERTHQKGFSAKARRYFDAHHSS